MHQLPAFSSLRSTSDCHCYWCILTNSCHNWAANYSTGSRSRHRNVWWRPAIAITLLTSRAKFKQDINSLVICDLLEDFCAPRISTNHRIKTAANRLCDHLWWPLSFRCIHRKYGYGPLHFHCNNIATWFNVVHCMEQAFHLLKMLIIVISIHVVDKSSIMIQFKKSRHEIWHCHNIPGSKQKNVNHGAQL